MWEEGPLPQDPKGKRGSRSWVRGWRSDLGVHMFHVRTFQLCIAFNVHVRYSPIPATKETMRLSGSCKQRFGDEEDHAATLQDGVQPGA